MQQLFQTLDKTLFFSMSSEGDSTLPPELEAEQAALVEGPEGEEAALKSDADAQDTDAESHGVFPDEKDVRIFFF